MLLTFVTYSFELVLQVGLIIQPVVIRVETPDILDNHLQFELACDILKREIRLLDLVSTFFNHIVVLVPDATPVLVNLLLDLRALAHFCW